jgi:hypothetical protein
MTTEALPFRVAYYAQVVHVMALARGGRQGTGSGHAENSDLI